MLVRSNFYVILCLLSLSFILINNPGLLVFYVFCLFVGLAILTWTQVGWICGGHTYFYLFKLVSNLENRLILIILLLVCETVFGINTTLFF